MKHQLKIMNKFLCAIVLALISAITCYSQDVITQKNGDKINAKIVEVGISEIKYKKFDNQDGPVYSIAKRDVLKIIYENGTTDQFSGTDNADPENLKLQAQADASKHYTRYKPAGTGTLVASLVSPIVGLIPAIATASSEPKEKNLNVPDSVLIQNPIYNDAYIIKASSIKRKKVWKNWLIGLGANVVATAILIATGDIEVSY